MAYNTLAYADRFDLKDVFGDCYKYNSLKLVTGNWIPAQQLGATYTIYTLNTIAQPKHLYFNNEKVDSVNSITGALQWKWNSATESLQVSIANSKSIDDYVIEAGKSISNMIDDALVFASEEFNAKIDNKYPRPLPKTRVTHSTDLEYESIVKRATCLICAKNMIKSKDPTNEDALVYEQEANEIIEGMNNGSIKLVWENDATEVGYFEADSNNSGTIVLEQVMGNWSGRTYDLIYVEVTGAGGLGVGEISISFGNSDFIGNDGGTIYTYKPSGSFDYIGSGLMIRFSQADNSGAFASGDKWIIPVKNTQTSGGITGSNVRSLNAVRNR